MEVLVLSDIEFPDLFPSKRKEFPDLLEIVLYYVYICPSDYICIHLFDMLQMCIEYVLWYLLIP